MAVTAANVRALEGAIKRHYEAGGSGDIGDSVYVDSNGDVQVTDANAAVSSECHGVVVAVGEPGATSFVSGDAVTVVTLGPVGGFSSLTPGAIQYVSETAGEITETAPTGAGTWTKVGGYAEAADVFYVMPNITAASSNS